MSTIAEAIVSVKSYEMRLADLESEMAAATRADDATAWLVAWEAKQDLEISRCLAEMPSLPDDDAGAPAELDADDGPSEVDHIWYTWYALGYDCVDAKPGDDLDTLRLWVARLAYERGWAEGMKDRYTWLDGEETGRIEAEEAEVRGILCGHGFGPEFDNPSWASDGC